MPEPVVVATWPFGRKAVEVAGLLLSRGRPALDAVVAGAQAVEDDLTSRTSVGFGSIPDRLGRLTLDACVMDGRTLACGAVAAVQFIRHPTALARRVMERTPHVLLVGEGALWFALQQGFTLEQPHTLNALRDWLEHHPDRPPPTAPNPNPPTNPPSTDSPPHDDHDTVTVLALDAQGHLAGACTTSGLAYKLPGRVGDSPLIGAGLYVDDTAGAAGATGVGEEIIRISGSALIVEWLRTGKTPQQACELACQRLHAAAARRGTHPARVAFLALDPQGRIGAAATNKTNFRYALARNNKVELLLAPEIPPQP
jgi:isoaspartyl peptidase/L-asparaginase-like protein (Ntn-hydrolase superfamily)